MKRAESECVWSFVLEDALVLTQLFLFILCTDSHSNILPIHEAVRNGEEIHPLQGTRTMAQTGESDGALSQDIYEIPPGIVSRQRHGLNV